MGGPLPAGHRLGRYEVLSKLASGGMAVVYAANAQGAAGFERIVAVKVLHANLAYEDEFIKMFLDEARLAARIRHPNVVSTIDISDSAESGYYLVMEYIEGDHLGALLAGAHNAGQSLPLPIALRIVADALAGLGAAHDVRDDSGRQLQIVHRDVSPHNILVGRDGVARLTDFGVAKAEDRLTHTRDGQVKGKLAYMAPEQASTGTSDARSDLFSMGIILWECVTARRLFRAESTAATLTKLLYEEIAPPSAIDPALAGLDAVLRRALERDPEHRFQTAEEFAEAIELAARYYGGLASRRAVSKAVGQFCAEKLTRDRRRIDAAMLALQTGSGATANLSEPPSGEVSLPSSSLSRSKPSGVFSNLTAPGLFGRGRAARRASGSVSVPRPIDPLRPPPPLGAVGALQVPEPPEVESLPDEMPELRPRAGSPLLLGAFGAAALIAAVWAARASNLASPAGTAPVVALPAVEVTSTTAAPQSPAPAAATASTSEAPRAATSLPALSTPTTPRSPALLLAPPPQPSVPSPRPVAAAANVQRPSTDSDLSVASEITGDETGSRPMGAPAQMPAAHTGARDGMSQPRPPVVSVRPAQRNDLPAEDARSGDSTHDLLPNPYKQ